MGIVAKDREIDGHKYTVTSFGAMEGVRIKSLLLKYLGPSVFSMFALSDSGKKFSETDIDLQIISAISDKLFDKLNESQYLDFILRLLATTRRDNQEITSEFFNTEFAGEYGSLYKVLFFVLEVNYKESFFGKNGIGSLLEMIKNLIPLQKNFLKD